MHTPDHQKKPMRNLLEMGTLHMHVFYKLYSEYVDILDMLWQLFRSQLPAFPLTPTLRDHTYNEHIC